MRTNPLARTRYPSQSWVTVGGLKRIAAGVFGLGSPAVGIETGVSSARDLEGGPYNLFEGDLFTPGTGNWVVDPTHETPLFTVWGRAFLRQPNTFVALQTAQVFANQMSPLYGVGGQIPGQMITQPLSMNQIVGSGAL
jgi:hypothetical protein